MCKNCEQTAHWEMQPRLAPCSCSMQAPCRQQATLCKLTATHQRKLEQHHSEQQCKAHHISHSMGATTKPENHRECSVGCRRYQASSGESSTHLWPPICACQAYVHLANNNIAGQKSCISTWGALLSDMKANEPKQRCSSPNGRRARQAAAASLRTAMQHSP